MATSLTSIRIDSLSHIDSFPPTQESDRPPVKINNYIIPDKKIDERIYKEMPEDASETIFSFLTESELHKVMQVSWEWRHLPQKVGCWTPSLQHRFSFFKSKRPDLSYRDYFLLKLSSYKLWKNKMNKSETLPIQQQFLFRSYLPYSNYTIGGSATGKVFIFDKESRRFDLHSACVDYMSIWNKFLISASTYSSEPTLQDNDVSIINLANGVHETYLHIEDLASGGRNPILNCNNGKLAIVENKNNILIYDIVKKESKTISESPAPISCLSQWKKYIIIGHNNGDIMIKNLASGESLDQIQTMNGIIDMSVTDNKLSICDVNRTVSIYDLLKKCHLYSFSPETFIPAGEDLETHNFARIKAWGNRVATISYNTASKNLFIHTWLINDSNFANVCWYRLPNYFEKGFHFVHRFEIIPVWDQFIVQQISPLNTSEGDPNLDLLNPFLINPFINRIRTLPPQIFAYDQKTHKLHSYFSQSGDMYNAEGESSIQVYDPKTNFRDLQKKRRAVYSNTKKIFINAFLTILAVGIIFSYLSRSYFPRIV